MGNGYPIRQPDQLSQFAADLKTLANRIKVLENPTGTQTADAVRQLRQLVDNLATEIQNVASSGATWTGPVADPTATGLSTAGGVTAIGTLRGDAGLTSVGAAVLDLSTIPGSRQNVWQHIASGRYGFAPSTRESKMNLSEMPFTATDARAVKGWLFQYKGQLAIRNDESNPNYDPDYVVPWDVGLMAEDLIAHNMRCFVVFNDDGSTKTINYDLFGALVPLVLDADIDARMRALESARA